MGLIRRVKIKPKKVSKMPRRGPWRSRKHLDFVMHQFACSVPGCCTGDKVIPAHVDKFEAFDPANDIPEDQRKGTSSKNGDGFTFPLCWSHHLEYGKSHDDFCAKHDLDPHALAKEARAQSPAWREYQRAQDHEKSIR